jgi:hypothetical protein
MLWPSFGRPAGKIGDRAHFGTAKHRRWISAFVVLPLFSMLA